MEIKLAAAAENSGRQNKWSAFLNYQFLRLIQERFFSYRQYLRITNTKKNVTEVIKVTQIR